jgi:folate-dependent phosphoribosylglycinamide formyltransferase PurN
VAQESCVKPRALLITSNLQRHIYVANVIAHSLDLCGIISEGKTNLTAHLKPTKEQDDLISKHFAARDAAELKLLGEYKEFPQCDVFPTEQGGSNNWSTYEWVKEKEPDVVLLYGSSIIKDPILSHYDGRIINMHLGLSPYYRGSATNYWPLVDGKPECVGVTIHLATLKVDGGDILTQVRPEGIKETDRAHEIGNKAIIAGARALADIVDPYLAGKIKPQAQDLKSGKLCRRKDFTPESLVQMQRNFENGMISNYLQNKAIRNAAYPLVTFP